MPKMFDSSSTPKKGKDLPRTEMKINWTRRNKLFAGLGGLAAALVAVLLVFNLAGVPGGGKPLSTPEFEQLPDYAISTIGAETPLLLSAPNSGGGTSDPILKQSGPPILELIVFGRPGDSQTKTMVDKITLFMAKWELRDRWTLFRVNVDTSEGVELATKYGVYRLPSLVISENGTVLWVKEGGVVLSEELKPFQNR